MGEYSRFSAERGRLVKGKRRERIRDRLYSTLGIDGDILGGVSVELRGRGAMIVRGCGKICEYLPQSIRLKTDDGEISVRGRELVCTSYRIGSVGIEGRIDSISFEEEGQ